MNRPALLTACVYALASAPAAAQGNPKPDSTFKPTDGQRVPAPAYRNRIVGVFDAQTGLPIEGAEVSDVMAGTKSLTSSTGNVSLFFLPEGSSFVRIRKVGYEPQTFPVAIIPQDSSTITVVLAPVNQSLPAVTTTARSRRGPGDTVQALERSGFYDRRNSGLAPVLAFTTAEKIQGLLLMSDVSYIGRGICTRNVYLDGARVEVPPKQGRALKQGIDQLIPNPGIVAGIETYSRTAEIPAEFGGTFAGPVSMSLKEGAAANACVTLIWTK
jgi:hypothetical protein